MLNLLSIEDQLFTCFDYTYSEEAREKLGNLFQQKITLQEVMERQTILKYFTGHWNKLKGFSYSKYEMREVMDFINSSDKVYFASGVLIFKLFFRKERFAIMAKTSQTIFFFHKLHLNHFASHSALEFPDHFQDKVNAVLSLFKDLKIGKYAEDIRNNKFSIKSIYEFLQLLKEYESENKLATFWNALFEYEMYWSVSKGITEHGFSFPHFSTNEFELSGFYLPGIKQVVKNDLKLNKSVNVLTGPNMSGKSTTLKALSLCILLSHIGLAVPATSCSIPFYDYILFSTNKNDDIKQGYSNFMNEVMQLKSAVHELVKGKRCFAIFDELFSGTNIDDALELMEISVKGLQRFTTSHFIISTHLYQIQQTANELLDAWQLEAKTEDGAPKHTYKLIKGWSVLRFGKLLFEREGLTALLQS